jgi:hypothetical protein
VSVNDETRRNQSNQIEIIAVSLQHLGQKHTQWLRIMVP